MKTFTYEQIADSFKLWEEYVDLDGIDTEEEFDEMTVEEKIDQITNCYGKESDLDLAIGNGAEV